MKKGYLVISFAIIIILTALIFILKKDKEEKITQKISASNRKFIEYKQIDSFAFDAPVYKIDASDNGLLIGIYGEDNNRGQFFILNKKKLSDFTVMNYDTLFDNISIFNNTILLHTRKTSKCFLLNINNPRQTILSRKLPAITYNPQLFSDSNIIFSYEKENSRTTFIGNYNLISDKFIYIDTFSKFCARSTQLDMGISGQGRFMSNKNLVSYSFLKSSDFFIADNNFVKHNYYFGKDSFAFPITKKIQIDNDMYNYVAEPNTNYVIDSKMNDSLIFMLMNFSPKGKYTESSALIDIYRIDGSYYESIILPNFQNNKSSKIAITKNNEIYLLLNDDKTLLKYAR